MPAVARRLALALALTSFVLAGCGGDDGEQGTTSAETETAGGVTAPEEPGSGNGVSLEKIGEFDSPDYVAQPPESDDLYVVEQPGRIRIVRGGRTLPDPALDIADHVSDSGEQGLLSVAFPPDFQSSRLLYLYFTGNDQDQHVVEYRARDDGTIDEASAREVLRMDDFASNHNGGLLLFGPDGRLYIGTGDGGGSGDPERNGQDLGSLLGKILRIDPRQAGGRPYTVPADNPFVDEPGARPEVCEFGLRNPWRFSFDRETRDLTIADVGQNAFEEVDFLPADRVCGNNFGWSAFEGEERFNSDQEAPGAIPPILTYELGDGNCAVTGGYVVRDPSLPSLNGRYVYGDFCAGELRSFRPNPSKAVDDGPLGLEVPGLSSFGEDGDGRVYAVSLEGPVYRLASK